MSRRQRAYDDLACPLLHGCTSIYSSFRKDRLVKLEFELLGEEVTRGLHRIRRQLVHLLHRPDYLKRHATREHSEDVLLPSIVDFCGRIYSLICGMPISR
jgi:hypothetical protein